MKQTAVEWLINEMHKKEQGLIETSYNHLFDQAKEMEKQQQDDLAIGFGACLIELLNDSETKTETMKELLEIYKK